MICRTLGSLNVIDVDGYVANQFYVIDVDLSHARGSFNVIVVYGYVLLLSS